MANPIHRLKVLAGLLFVFVLTSAPSLARAESLPRDILIKPPGQGAPVYYLANDDRRYVFPNQKTYETWFSDFSGIHEVSPDQLAEWPLGGNVTYRPGIRMVKITSDPKVYVVDEDACLRWVTSEPLAVQMYGTDWNQRVDDVPDAFFFNYSICEPIDSPLAFQPLAVAQTTTSINAQKSLHVSANARVADTQPDIGDAVPRSCTPKVDITKHGLKVSVSDDGLPGETFTVLAGGSGLNLARFDLTSENEDMIVSRLSVRAEPAWAVSSLSLYFDGEQVGGPLVADQNGQATFKGLSLRVAKDQTRHLTVRGSLHEMSPNGLASGQPVTVTLNSDFFQAYSALSCSETVLSGGGVLGERLPLAAEPRIVRQVKPALAVEPLPSLTLQEGALPILRFRITPDGIGEMGFRRLVLNLTGEFSQPISLVAEPEGLRRLGDSQGRPGEYRLSGTCANTTGPSCVLAVTLDDWETVNEADGQVYEIAVSLTGAPTAGDRLAIAMLEDMEPILVGDYPSQHAYNFIWSDSLYESNGEIKAHLWANGAHLDGLPSEPYALIR